MAVMAAEVVLKDLPFTSGDDVVVLISGLGATPVMELYIFFNKIADILSVKGMNINHSYVGNYFTTWR
jgi:dihydroxyacetone kinase-like protein